MAKASANYITGIQSSSLTPEWSKALAHNWNVTGSGANIRWQDTTSNASYCSAAQALGAIAPRARARRG